MFTDEAVAWRIIFQNLVTGRIEALREGFVFTGAAVLFVFVQGRKTLPFVLRKKGVYKEMWP